MSVLIYLLCILVVAHAGPATETYKDQYCTDPRTMRKHAAYTEWADAYSCTRHRCQPGGRNLAIYTVGCKRVEAPESAIECEEVVEDTNMQFPYCCTRLRCLVVVRGEVWTRVLGQPWETLPAAPWSHMYKMKKPPPGDTAFLPKNPGEGPIYELQTEADGERDKVLRAGKKGPTTATEATDCNEVNQRAAPAPDIVIALSTNTDNKEHKKEGSRHKRGRKASPNANSYFDEDPVEPRNEEPEETVVTEKPLEPQSEERYYANAYGVTQKVPSKSQHHQQVSWTEIPQNQWNEHDPTLETENTPRAEHNTYHQPEYPAAEAPEKKEIKSANLQALVDAIGSRMRDIESVVQRMSEKVQVKPTSAEATSDLNSGEKRNVPDAELQMHPKKEYAKDGRAKKPNPEGEHYKRFHGHGNKYVHGSGDITTEPPLFVEDSNLNGYFSDASNTMVRRANPPKEPAATYMAPVENRRKTATHITVASDVSEDVEKKHKKRSHKKKRTKSGHHKKHHDHDHDHGKDEKRKRFNRLNSVELDRNVISLEDSSAGAASK